MAMAKGAISFSGTHSDTTGHVAPVSFTAGGGALRQNSSNTTHINIQAPGGRDRRARGASARKTP